jgi:hypothetical protein
MRADAVKVITVIDQFYCRFSSHTEGIGERLLGGHLTTFNGTHTSNVLFCFASDRNEGSIYHESQCMVYRHLPDDKL